MARVYVHNLADPGGLLDLLDQAGYEVVRETPPRTVDDADLALVPAREGITSALRHDLNNPLTAVLGFAELLLRAEDLSPASLARVEKIHAHAVVLRDILRRTVEWGSA